MTKVETTAAIVRQSLHNQLVDRLSLMISRGELLPGSKVPEKELCQRFSVSRTPMREALKVLAAAGLVTLTPNRGARVAIITEVDLDQVFPVMGALEALAGELAAKCMTDAELAAIERLHASMLDAYRAGHLKAYFRANEAIHDAILAAARNPTLSHQYRQLSARVRRSRYVAQMSPAHWASAVADHEEMIAALRKRDARKLAAVLKRHVARKREMVALWLENAPAQS